MPNKIIINKKIRSFNSQIEVSGDKSLSIRWVLFASLASGKSRAYNLLKSEDVLAAVNAIKQLGIKVRINKKFCEIHGKGLQGFHYKKNLKINAKNSGTLGRLILGLIINSNKKIKLIGDKSLSKRDFKRVADPLKKFGAKIILKQKKNLPLTIEGTIKSKPIKYHEKKGSAQCKSTVIFAGLRTDGETIIKAKKSRNHTELLCKYLKLPIKVKKFKKFDLITVNKAKKIKPLNYKIPSDISSSAFFIALVCLVKNSKLTIKKVNINPTRTGLLTILKMMGLKIKFKNKTEYKGEKLSDLIINTPRQLKAINCPSELNSGAIDEFLVIFLIAAKAKGISYFKNLGELNQKESPRLQWGQKILSEIGVKTIVKNNSIKIYGNPDLKINKKIIIKDYLKDHRVLMTSVIAALSFGGEWHVHDKDSTNTSFPNFFKIINKIKNER